MAAQVAIQQSSPMVRAVLRDAAAAQCITAFLSLQCLLRLLRSCRDWRRAITCPTVTPPADLALVAPSGSNRWPPLVVIAALFAPARSLEWMHARLGALHFADGWQRFDEEGVDWTLAKRLHSLRIDFGFHTPNVQRVFGGLILHSAATLTSLRLSCTRIEIADKVWPLVPLLRCLQLLHLRDKPVQWHKKPALDFGVLLPLARLEDLCLCPVTLLPAQVDALILMPQLTALDTGSWGRLDPDPLEASWGEYLRREDGAKVWFNRATLETSLDHPNTFSLVGLRVEPLQEGEAAFLDERADDRLARFVRARLESKGPPLRVLGLGKTRLTRPLWSLVTQLTTLESLDPLAWPADFVAADWESLLTFRALQHVQLNSTAPGQDLPDLPGLVSVLTRCRALSSVTIHNAPLSDDLFGALLAGCQIRSLELQDCRIESLGVLHAGAHLLQHVVIADCLTLAGADDLHLHESFPTLPLLCTLFSHDRGLKRREGFGYNYQLDEETAAAFRERMPQLRQVSLLLHTLSRPAVPRPAQPEQIDPAKLTVDSKSPKQKETPPAGCCGVQ